MSMRFEIDLQTRKKSHLILSAITLMLLFCVASNVDAQQKKAGAVEAPPACFLSEFRHIALSTHEPVQRTAAAQNWLSRNVVSCSIEQLNLINANRANWLGTSDSSHFSFMLDSMIEYKAANKPEMLAQIFGSLGKEGTASVQTFTVNQPQRAQAQPAYDYQQQYQQQQAYPQAQQQPAYPQATYPQPNAAGR